MKYCIDCKHWLEGGKCKRLYGATSLVTGNSKADILQCTFEREETPTLPTTPQADKCGKQGKYWEESE